MGLVCVHTQVDDFCFLDCLFLDSSLSDQQFQGGTAAKRISSNCLYISHQRYSFLCYFSAEAGDTLLHTVDGALKENRKTGVWACCKRILSEEEASRLPIDLDTEQEYNDTTGAQSRIHDLLSRWGFSCEGARFQNLYIHSDSEEMKQTTVSEQTGDLRIRRAASSEDDIIHQCAVHAKATAELAQFTDLTLEESCSYLRVYARGACLLIAEQVSVPRVVGFMIAEPALNGYQYLDAFCVQPDMRGLGVGQLLMCELKRLTAGEWNSRGLWLVATKFRPDHAFNGPTMKFYRRSGFRAFDHDNFVWVKELTVVTPSSNDTTSA